MIQTRVEGLRGCGARKPGGLYLVSGQLSEPCPRLPLELDRCPHCGQGIGPARGWTWITPAIVIPAQEHGGWGHNLFCPLGFDGGLLPADRIPRADDPHRIGDRAGLIWIGEKFYPTPDAFMDEAKAMGVSRRIKAVPHGFELGKTWVVLGHRKALKVAGSMLVDASVTVSPPETEYRPGVVTLFLPTAIEYVTKGTESDEEIKSLEERGITPVRVLAEGSYEAMRWEDRLEEARLGLA